MAAPRDPAPPPQDPAEVASADPAGPDALAAPGAPLLPATAPRRDRALSKMVAYTWSRHWPAEMLMGISGGVLGLVAFCLQRSLGAPKWTSPWLIILGQGLWLLAPAWPPLLARMRHQTAFVWIGLFSRGPLLLMAFAAVTPTVVSEVGGGGGTSGAQSTGAGTGSWWLLLVAYLVSNNLDALYTPHRNALLKANYPLTMRGRIYGWVTAITSLAAVVTANLVGRVLDHDPTAVRWIFPMSAVAGLLAHFGLARIRWRYDGPRHVQPGAGVAIVRHSLRDAAKATRQTIRTDRDFRDFEIGFMLYGLGLLSASPLIVTRFAQDATFSMAAWTTADRLVLPVTQLLLVPFVGRLSDRIGVVRVASLAFLSLVAYFLLMGVVTNPWHLMGVNVLFGFCMAGVNVAWSLGPLHFAPPGKAHHYSSVHVACVGVRSILGPLLGMGVMAAFSFEAALVVSAGLEVAAGLWMLRLARRVHIVA